MSGAEAPGERFTVLDSWRGICATLVALMHFKGLYHGGQTAFLENAYLFVDFFFVLSGFVITHAYWDRIAGARDAGLFLLRRLGRLWPLHAFVLAVLVLMELALLGLAPWFGAAYPRAPFSDGQSVAQILSNLALVNGWGLHDTGTWNNPSWSISTEWGAYILFALCCLLPRRLATGLLLLTIPLGAVIVLSLSPDYMDTTYDYGLWRCFMGFAVGHVVWRLRRRHPVTLSAPTVLEVAAVAAVIWFCAALGLSPLSVAAPFLFGAVVWVFAAEAGSLSRLLKLRPFQWMGRVSYSIYMVHWGIAFALRTGLMALAALTDRRFFTPDAQGRRWLDLGSVWLNDAVIVLYLALVFAVAGWTYRRIEDPGRRAMNARTRALAAPPVRHP